jgi:prolyl-tRNA synthetase
VSLDGLPQTVSAILDDIQKDLFTRAKDTYDERLKPITKWQDLVPALDNKNVVVIPWCEREKCEDEIKEKSARA